MTIIRQHTKLCGNPHKPKFEVFEQKSGLPLPYSDQYNIYVYSMRGNMCIHICMSKTITMTSN